MLICKNCAFSEKSVKDNKLECRALPPTSIMSSDSKIIVRFPLVDPDMWCGQGWMKTEENEDDTV